ncbi:MAG: DUF1177 domain-containing protein [Lutispora sp.]|nr:DUF1177 domain-containing protein [Lutispora sp.]
MLLKHVLEVYEVLDSPQVTGSAVQKMFFNRGCKDVEIKKVSGEKCNVEFIKVFFSGKNGKSKNGSAPTIGLLGQLGGIGCYPVKNGFVSDGDGALVVLACGLKLADMVNNGSMLDGDVIITTHVCTKTPIKPRKLVPFLDLPLPMDIMVKSLVDPRAEAILSVDTTKGNRIINQRGFAITPTVKEGYILKVSDDLIDIMSTVTGLLPSVMAITTQDITTYKNNIYHINSIMQPAIATNSPVVGVAITAQIPVAGTATGATHFMDIEATARFCLEVAKYYGLEECKFYDSEEFEKMVSIYGSMSHLQKQSAVLKG